MEITTVRDVQAPEWLQGERPRPEVPAVVGAAGGILLLFGMLVLLGTLDGDSLRMGGIALSLFGLVVGGALLSVEKEPGALRSAGVAVAAGAAPVLAFLLVNDPMNVDDKSDFLLAGLLAVVLWGVLFVVGPGRGHGLFVGLALTGLWLTALLQTSPEAVFSPFGAFTSVRAGGSEEVELFTEPGSEFEAPAPGGFDEEQRRQAEEEMRRFQEEMRQQMEEDRMRREQEMREWPQPSFDVPEFPYQEESLGDARLVRFGEDGDDGKSTAPIVVSFLFGLVYLAGALVLDGMGLRRVGSAVLSAGVVALAVGVTMVGPVHGAAAGGIAGLTAAALLIGLGIAGDRRFTAWLGAGVLALSVTGLVGDAFDDSDGAAALALLVVGAALVAAGWFAAGGMGRPTPPAAPFGGPTAPLPGPGDPPPPPRRIVI